MTFHPKYKLTFLSVFIYLITGTVFARPGEHKVSETGTPSGKAVYDLIKRILPTHADHFEIAFIPQEEGKDVFELESKKGKIVLRGNNGVSIASALNYYLKNYAHCDISWNGTNLDLPDPLPAVKDKIRKITPYKYRYYLNYCTFNYTMSWWDWDRWQWEIDWMALNGINMPLALTGQNIIWDRVYKSLGFTDADLKTFFSGPAYFNWFWMGNLDGWGGPLPQSWMKSHEDLQKKILNRERALGMAPILPAFTGHVPPSFENKFPKAGIKKTLWSGFPDSVAILDPNDPMFTTIGKKFIEEEVKTFGTNHLYSADTFNENTPPTSDSTFLNDISRKVYQSMAGADPKATWIMQGWMFSYSAKYWQPTQMKALLNAVPNDHMIILDLYSENKPVWNRTEAYYGKPWIWCMLHNFGGNISLYGRMDHVANDPANALNDPGSGKMLGIGLTPEAIEQNPVMYELMLENVWRDKPVDLDSWLKDYAQRRYGEKNLNAERAWDILRKTVYKGAITSGGPESIITGRPTFNASTRWTSTRKAYHPEDLIPAWDNLIIASDKLNSEGFQYDLVDVTRQVLANYADTLQQKFAAAYKNNDQEAFKKYSGQFLEVIDDMDRLLATRKGFLLGRWLNAAKSQGKTPDEKKLFEKNARNQITLWGDKDSRLHDYACKQWSGMLKGFYKPRWEQFFAYVNQCMQQQKKVDEKHFETIIREWEWNWVNGNEVYKDRPEGDPVATAKEMYTKYKKMI